MDVGGRHSGCGSRLRGAPARALRIVLVAVLLPLPILAGQAAVSADDHVDGRTFVVNSILDLPDASSSDDVCSIVGGPNICTLRAAIKQANASEGHDRIEFAIPGLGPHRLTPLTRYPIIDDEAGVTIDGYTQPGSAVNTAAHGSNAVLHIEIAGRGPTAIDGLYLSSADNVLRGLAMFDFRRTIYIRTSDAVDNEIIGNFIGTDSTGTFGQSVLVVNNNGVHIERGASRTLIGKPGLANRNVLSGNGDKGVAIYDNTTDNNLVRNNVVGLSPAGDRLRNWGHGIDINYNASDNVVGGFGPGDGNLVSGNELSGVEVSHDAGPDGSTTGNDILGNLIGTSLDGSSGSSRYRNHEFGVNLEGKSTCPTPGSCGPDVNTSLVEGNIIVGSAAGITIWKGAHNNIVRNNRIGLLPNGTVAASSVHTIWGVLIEAGAFDNLIDSNVIAGVLDGIQVRPDNDYTTEPTNPEFDTFGNTFRRNSIWGIVNGFGIDIAPISSVNDEPAELSSGVQGGIAAPVISSATEDVVSVASCGGCLVELFTSDAGLTSNYGQGRSFVADRVADESGNATLVLRADSTEPYVLRADDRITATVTDASGNTSEFSLRVIVAAGNLGPPPTTTQTTQTTQTTPTAAVRSGTMLPASDATRGGLAGGVPEDAHRCGPICWARKYLRVSR